MNPHPRSIAYEIRARVRQSHAAELLARFDAARAEVKDQATARALDALHGVVLEAAPLPDAAPAEPFRITLGHGKHDHHLEPGKLYRFDSLALTEQQRRDLCGYAANPRGELDVVEIVPIGEAAGVPYRREELAPASPVKRGGPREPHPEALFYLAELRDFSHLPTEVGPHGAGAVRPNGAGEPVTVPFGPGRLDTTTIKPGAAVKLLAHDFYREDARVNTRAWEVLTHPYLKTVEVVPPGRGSAFGRGRNGTEEQWRREATSAELAELAAAADKRSA